MTEAEDHLTNALAENAAALAGFANAVRSAADRCFQQITALRFLPICDGVDRDAAVIFEKGRSFGEMCGAMRANQEIDPDEIERLINAAREIFLFRLAELEAASTASPAGRA